MLLNFRDHYYFIKNQNMGNKEDRLQLLVKTDIMEKTLMLEKMEGMRRTISRKWIYSVMVAMVHHWET